MTVMDMYEKSVNLGTGLLSVKRGFQKIFQRGVWYTPPPPGPIGLRRNLKVISTLNESSSEYEVFI
jgi:hypothetical protein